MVYGVLDLHARVARRETHTESHDWILPAGERFAACLLGVERIEEQEAAMWRWGDTISLGTLAADEADRRAVGCVGFAGFDAVFFAALRLD